jgi:inosine/xanthosine triphosphate pyrophosphatase family protein
MKELVFSTGNAEKFLTAQHVCRLYGIELIRMNINPPEIQEEDPAKVAIDKAAKAFAACKYPVVITDDSWAFSGLKTF